MSYYPSLMHAIRILDRHRMDVLQDTGWISTDAWKLLLHAADHLRDQAAEEHKRAMREPKEDQ